MKVKTLIASDTTTWNMTWLPQFLFFVATTVPTMFKVSVFGDGVIADLDGDGLDALNSIKHVGQVTNGYMINLADGIVKGKNVEISITNAVAGTVDVYGIVLEDGDIYVQSIRQQALASSGVEIRDFAYVAFPSAAVGDVWNITFEDDTTHKFDRAELNALLCLEENPVGTKYNIDNLDGTIRVIQFTPAATQTIYIVQFAPVGNVPASGSMV